MRLFLNIIQTIGMAVPLVGVGALIRKEQNHTSLYLMLTNIGCLLINGSYMLLLQSQTPREALAAMKLEYLGNVFFYLFFAMFLLSYLKIKRGWILLFPWLGLDVANLFCLWNDGLNHFVYREIQFILHERFGFLQVQTTLGVLGITRYALISFTLLGSLLYMLYRMFRMKAKKERNNMARLIGTQFIIIVSLNVTILANISYDVMPICASLSIIAIILGVIRGEMLNAVETGREWVMEHMDNAFLVVDPEYGYLDANGCAKTMFPWLKSLTRNQCVGPELQYIFFSPESSVHIQNRYYEKTIETIRQEEEVIGYGLLLMDVTEQRQLMEQLQTAKQSAEDANQAKSDFMSNMSHEIRTPMNAIVGMTEILLRTPMPEQEKGYLWNIKNSGNALLAIINDILDFSKIESGKMEIAEEDYEPMSMFHDLSMIFLNRIGGKEIELLYDIDKDLPRKLCGDDLRLRQVIINLMNNAIKFTEEGFVRLSVKTMDTVGDEIRLKFIVEDSGQGIREEDLPKLFGMFQQVDTKKNRQKEGTGLGLAISKQLIELMGGEIWVESEYGTGSKFIFTLRQKVRSENCAAAVHTENATVSGVFENPYLTECLTRLAEVYGVAFVPPERALDEQVDCFFTDEKALLNEEERNLLKNRGTMLCLLQNPMTKKELETDVYVVNKPLYSLNFCQVVNRERAATTTGEADLLNFKAPTAKVLIVDDNEMNLKVAVSLLEPLQMQIDLADNGKTALAMIQKKEYDIVFMDHMMPIMDGVEATQMLRAMEGEYYQNVPVIALTANVISEARETFRQAGMSDFAAKPIKMKEICAILRKWLPASCIEESETPAAQSVQDAQIQLPPIEGLDVAEGVRNSGSEKLFYSLLGDFYCLIDMKSDKIEKCLADGLLRDYTIEVHALKNTARMIGALELSQEFYELEQLGNAQEEDVLRDKTPGVLEHYRSYKPILKPYAESQNQEKQAVSADVMAESLKKLSDAVDSFDLDAADATMKELEQFQWPAALQDDMERLRALVADVAMDEIMETANRMVKILSVKQEEVE